MQRLQDAAVAEGPRDALLSAEMSSTAAALDITLG